jgi:hypothetical protein
VSAAAAERLREWVLRNAALPVAQLDERTPLLESGLLTSFQVMELILFLEELRGRPLDVTRLEPGVFRDLESIRLAFLGEEA